MLIKLKRLNPTEKHTFSIGVSDQQKRQLITEFDLVSLGKVRLEGHLSAAGSADWVLKADFGATVEQSCVVTLEPVKTRIEEKITRNYVAGFEFSDDAESETVVDELTETLPAEIDLFEILKETLAIGLPAYPRKSGAEVGNLTVAPPNTTPLSDDDVKPFAGLADLKDKLTKNSD